MSYLKCKIKLGTWYQEHPNEVDIEILPEDFSSIDEALEWLSVNYQKVLDDFPVVRLKIEYV